MSEVFHICRQGTFGATAQIVAATFGTAAGTAGSVGSVAAHVVRSAGSAVEAAENVAATASDAKDSLDFTGLYEQTSYQSITINHKQVLSAKTRVDLEAKLL